MEAWNFRPSYICEDLWGERMRKCEITYLPQCNACDKRIDSWWTCPLQNHDRIESMSIAWASPPLYDKQLSFSVKNLPSDYILQWASWQPWPNTKTENSYHQDGTYKECFSNNRYTEKRKRKELISSIFLLITEKKTQISILLGLWMANSNIYSTRWHSIPSRIKNIALRHNMVSLPLIGDLVEFPFKFRIGMIVNQSVTLRSEEKQMKNITNIPG